MDDTVRARSVVKVDRRIRWHYTTTILRLRIGARLTRYRSCKFHNFARTISRHADGISRYSVPPSADPLLPLCTVMLLSEFRVRHRSRIVGHVAMVMSSEVNKAVIDHRLRPRCCHLGSYFKRSKSSPVRPLACNWYYGAQLIAKPKAACALRFSWAATSEQLGFLANMTSSIKPEVHNISLRRQMKTEPRPQVTCTKNLVKIGRVVPKTRSSQYSAPLSGAEE